MKAKNLSLAADNPTKTEYAIILAAVIIFAFATYELFGDDLGTLIDNIHNPQTARTCGLFPMKTWRADFFDDTDDALASRSVFISADNEDDAVDKAVAQMGNAARVEFIRMVTRGN